MEIKINCYAFSSFSLLYLSSSLRNCPLGFITFGRSPLHIGQNHFPLGFVVNDTQEKWNHSIGQRSLSHKIISPKDIWTQRQYVGSSGSIVSCSSGGGVSSLWEAWPDWRAFRFFFFPDPGGILTINDLQSKVNRHIDEMIITYFSCGRLLMRSCVIRVVCRSLRCIVGRRYVHIVQITITSAASAVSVVFIATDVRSISTSSFWHSFTCHNIIKLIYSPRWWFGLKLVFRWLTCFIFIASVSVSIVTMRRSEGTSITLTTVGTELLQRAPRQIVPERIFYRSACFSRRNFVLARSTVAIV